MFWYLFCLKNKNIEQASIASKIFPILSRFVLIWALTASNFIGTETSFGGFGFYSLIGFEIFLFLCEGTLNVLCDLIKIPSPNLSIFCLRKEICFFFCKTSIVYESFLCSKIFQSRAQSQVFWIFYNYILERNYQNIKRAKIVQKYSNTSS